jgi:hypothetical protein
VEEDEKGPDQPEWGREQPVGPEDEYEALRGQLLVGLRRNPADRRLLLRHAEALARMEVALKRLSPKKREELTVNLERVLSRFKDVIKPSD